MLKQITVRVEVGPYVLHGREVGFLEVRQRVGAHAECMLTFARDPQAVASPVASPVAPLRIAELAGATVRVVFVCDTTQAYLTFAGTVREAEVEHLATGAGNVTVRALSDSYILAEHTDRRYFRKQDAIGLARAVDVHVADGAGEGGTVRDYVQAGVSTWAFLAQITAEEGLQLRPRWPRTASETADSVAEVGRGFVDETHTLTWGRELLRLATGLAPANAGVTGAFYEPTTKHDHRFRGVRAQVAWLGGARPVVTAARDASTTDAGGGDPGHLEPGRVSGVRARSLTEFRDRLELASARRLGSTVTARGASVLPALRAGDRIKVAAAPVVSGESDGGGCYGGDGGESGAASSEIDDRTGVFGLITVTHLWNGTLYENLFTATPWADYHPDPVSVAPSESMVGGSLTLGVVVQVTDPKGLGRVRVRLAWMEDSEHTAWVRVAGLGGGNGRGVGVLPSIGDEVVLGALDGDPEHLVLLAGLWNGVDKAGHAPGRQHWVTPAGNTLVFTEGKAGADEEKVTLYTQRGKAWVQLSAKGPSGVPTVTVRSAGDLSLEAPDGELRITAKSMLTHITEDVKRQVERDVLDEVLGAVTVKVAKAVTVGTDAGLQLTAKADASVRSDTTLTLSAPLVKVNPPGFTAPPVTVAIPDPAATAFKEPPVPSLGLGRSTQDPRTPRRRELAAQATSTSATTTPPVASTAPTEADTDTGGAVRPDQAAEAPSDYGPQATAMKLAGEFGTPLQELCDP